MRNVDAEQAGDEDSDRESADEVSGPYKNSYTSCSPIHKDVTEPRAHVTVVPINGTQ